MRAARRRASSGDAALDGIRAARGAQTQFVLVAFAFGCLVRAFLNNDFSVLYVAQNSNSVAADRSTGSPPSWGSHEGSLLLWVLMLAGWTGAVALLQRATCRDAMVARVLGVLGLVAVGFPAVHAAHVQPVRAAARGRPRDAT
jgi:cytochrome c-type biogenesis protein CcmF